MNFPLLDPTQCAKVRDAAAAVNSMSTAIGIKGHCVMDVRFLKLDLWLRDILHSALTLGAAQYGLEGVQQLNNQGHRRFDNALITRVASYPAPAHFCWHVDVAPPPQSWLGKKHWLTGSILLRDDYVGGDLQVIEGDETIAASRAVGDVAIFPSHLRHRVTPITGGTRSALVFWGAVADPFAQPLRNGGTLWTDRWAF